MTIFQAILKGLTILSRCMTQASTRIEYKKEHMFQKLYSKLTADSSKDQHPDTQARKKATNNSDTLPLDKALICEIQRLANDENKTAEEMANELLAYAIQGRQTADAWLEVWEGLTPREKQTASLTCLGYTNRQIATEMVISLNTVKTHVKKVLSRFHVNSKGELQNLLADWDFSDWIKQELHKEQESN